jgi:VWFA-related protein
VGIRFAVTGCCIIAAGLAPAARHLPQQGASFRSTTEVVLVDVLVTRGNAPVLGLRAEDFEVRDSGQRQKIDLIALDSMPVDLLMALDVSASLTGPQLEQLKEAARSAVAALRPIDRAHLLNFSNDVKRGTGWTADRDQLNRAIDALAASGWTSLFDATFAALNVPDTPDRRPLLLVFTDGADTASWLTATEVLSIAEHTRLTVYGVSAPAADPRTVTVITTSAGSRTVQLLDKNRELDRVPPARLRERLLSDPFGFRALFLRVIVNDTGGELLHTMPGADLRTMFLNVLERFSRRYLLSYTPVGVQRAGWHPIEVRLKDDSLKVTARRGYSR